MKLKKGDFIEIEYTGKVKETGEIFDLTSEEEAKKNNIYNPKAHYGPVIICIGQNDILKGLDTQLIGKEKGEYTIEISPENGFGKKNPKLMKIVSTNIFKKQKIAPFPGLRLNMDGLLGTIRSVSGGRTIVDFNHPLAGRNLIYKIKINQLITKPEEKLRGFIQLHLGKSVKSELKDNCAIIHIDLPEPVQKEIEKKLKNTIKEIKKVAFSKTTTKE